jgi:hypothetical protein
MNKLGLSHLRLKKLVELIHAELGRYATINKTGEIRYAKNILIYIFRPRFTSYLEFLSTTDRSQVDSTIDTTYSQFILGEYSIVDKGADFKFNTLRNLFKWGFHTKQYMINHYIDKLSLPIIKRLKKEFVDLDVLNIVVPQKINIMAMVREFENGIYDYVRREYALVRAGPYNIRDPLIIRLVA